MQRIGSQWVAALRFEHPDPVVLVLPVRSGDIDIPAAIQPVQFRRPDFAGSRTSFGGSPNNVLRANSGQAVGDVNADAAVALGEAGQVTALVLDEPRIRPFANRVGEA